MDRQDRLLAEIVTVSRQLEFEIESGKFTIEFPVNGGAERPISQLSENAEAVDYIIQGK
jgi:hypothetical protein